MACFVRIQANEFLNSGTTGGKVLRDGLGQASGLTDAQAVDTVITNACILDYTGIYKADVGIKKGKIVGIGKAGNPDTMSHVDPSLYVGVTVSLFHYWKLTI